MKRVPTLLRVAAARVKQAWLALLGKGRERDPEQDAAVRDALAGRRKPGFDCPKCRERIVIDIATLLSQASVTCRGCSLTLGVNWQEDVRARAALEKVQEAARQVERAKAFRR